jgi:hypothetical protein
MWILDVMKGCPFTARFSALFPVGISATVIVLAAVTAFPCMFYFYFAQNITAVMFQCMFKSISLDRLFSSMLSLHDHSSCSFVRLSFPPAHFWTFVEVCCWRLKFTQLWSISSKLWPWQSHKNCMKRRGNLRHFFSRTPTGSPHPPLSALFVWHISCHINQCPHSFFALMPHPPPSPLPLQCTSIEPTAHT